jgi:polar amino acid transport system substrate-binding protein
MKYKIFTQRDNPNIDKIRSVTALSDLKDLKIIDYIGDGWAEKNLAQYGVEWSPNLTSACKMLAAHRGDVFLQDEVMVWYAIKNIKKREADVHQPYNDIIAIDAPVSEVNFHLLVRKDSPFLHLLPQFDAAVRAMHQDGDFDKITHKWLQ